MCFARHNNLLFVRTRQVGIEPTFSEEGGFTVQWNAIIPSTEESCVPNNNKYSTI